MPDILGDRLMPKNMLEKGIIDPAKNLVNSGIDKVKGWVLDAMKWPFKKIISGVRGAVEMAVEGILMAPIIPVGKGGSIDK